MCIYPVLIAYVLAAVTVAQGDVSDTLAILRIAQRLVQRQRMFGS